MAWTTPRTYVAGEILTAAILNTHVRDNLNLLATDVNTGDGSITRWKRLYSNSSSLGSAAGGGETTLMSYPLGAGTLATDGQVITAELWFYSAANTNVKTIKVYFGATPITMTAASVNNQIHKMVLTVMRQSATTQIMFCTNTQTNAAGSNNAATASPTETLSGAVTIKATGASAALNDVQQTLMIVTSGN